MEGVVSPPTPLAQGNALNLAPVVEPHTTGSASYTVEEIDSSESESDTMSVSNSSDAPPKVPTAMTKRKVKAVEAFCGTAGLSLALTREGVQTIGVDFNGNKDKPKARCMWLDLAKPSGQKEFRKMMQDAELVYVSFAPPSGTSARARDRRLKNPDGSPATIDPKPLRSDDYPDGLPTLQGVDKAKVENANELYRFTVEMVVELSRLGVTWSVENPEKSRMWDTASFRQLSRLKANGHLQYERITFDMCMHGGERPKSTTLLVSGDIDFGSLRLQCDGSHQHKPWGMVHEKGTVFATAIERTYPYLLCQRIARLVAAKYGAEAPQKDDQLEKANANVQPKQRYAPVIAEYRSVETIHGVRPEELQALKAITAQRAEGLQQWQHLLVPAGSKVLNVWQESDNGGLSTIRLGLAWTTQEFIEVAQQVTHPFDRRTKVPTKIAEAIWKVATQGPVVTAEKRKMTIEMYAGIKKQLERREAELHSKLHADVQKVVEGKAILLFKRMLEDAGYDDLDVANLLVTGVKLIGDLPELPFWKPEPEKMARITPQMLWSGAKEAQREVLSQDG